MGVMTEYKDIVAIHPGYYITGIIEELEITESEFAERVGIDTQTVAGLLDGTASITEDSAKKISDMTGTSKELWLNLQSSYEEKMNDIQKMKESERR